VQGGIAPLVERSAASRGPRRRHARLALCALASRSMPSRLPPLEYPSHYALRRVSTNGGIRWDAWWVNATHALGGEYVGLVEIDDGAWDLYLGPLRLGRTYLVEDIHGCQRRRRRRH